MNLLRKLDILPVKKTTENQVPLVNQDLPKKRVFIETPSKEKEDDVLEAYLTKVRSIITKHIYPF